MLRKLRDGGQTHKQNADLRLEAYAGHCLLNSGGNLIQPNCQQHRYSRLDGAELPPNESNAYEMYHNRLL